MLLETNKCFAAFVIVASNEIAKHRRQRRKQFFHSKFPRHLFFSDLRTIHSNRSMSRGWSARLRLSIFLVVLVVSTAHRYLPVFSPLTARASVLAPLSGVRCFQVQSRSHRRHSHLSPFICGYNLQDNKYAYILITKVNDNGGIAIWEGKSREESIGKTAASGRSVRGRETESGTPYYTLNHTIRYGN
jgi:hypothetical protein